MGKKIISGIEHNSKGRKVVYQGEDYKGKDEYGEEFNLKKGKEYDIENDIYAMDEMQRVQAHERKKGNFPVYSDDAKDKSGHTKSLHGYRKEDKKDNMRYGDAYTPEGPKKKRTLIKKNANIEYGAAKAKQSKYEQPKTPYGHHKMDREQLGRDLKAQEMKQKKAAMVKGLR